MMHFTTIAGGPCVWWLEWLDRWEAYRGNSSVHRVYDIPGKPGFPFASNSPMLDPTWSMSFISFYVLDLRVQLSCHVILSDETWTPAIFKEKEKRNFIQIE